MNLRAPFSYHIINLSTLCHCHDRSYHHKDNQEGDFFLVHRAKWLLVEKEIIYRCKYSEKIGNSHHFAGRFKRFYVF
jgi:hypothetical protein